MGIRNITDCFVNCLCQQDIESISEEVYSQAKRCFLDYLGVTFAGAELIKEHIELLLNDGLFEPGSSVIIGRDETSSVQTAALINGLSSHAMELDDGHRAAMVHAGGAIISALLSISKKEKLTGKDFLYGIIIGYETAIRLGCAIQPAHKFQGYHVTGTCGTIGAAVAVAAALKLNAEEIKNAVSAAATSAAGILEIIEDGSELKPYNAGRAAMDGVTAAFMAKAGFKGPDDVLGGERGFLSVMASQADPSILSWDAGDVMKIQTIYQKPYAACRYCHAPVEAVLQIREQNQILPDNIKKIDVETFELAVKGHEHTTIRGVASAKMSIPYSIAIALQSGQADVAQFTDEVINDAQIQELMKKVNVQANQELSMLVPDKRAAIVRITMKDNQILSERIDYPKGEPENPLLERELEEKAISLMIYGNKTRDKAMQIIEQVKKIETEFCRLLERI